jgi:hypothetical protein
LNAELMSAEIVVTKTIGDFISYLPEGGRFGEEYADQAIALLRRHPKLLKCGCGHKCGGCTWRPASGREPKAFKSLQNIFDRLCKAHFGGREPAVKYGSMPHHTTNADIAGGTHMIDGYFCRNKAQVPADGKPDTADLICNAEYKLRCSQEDIVDVSSTIELVVSPRH